jgi:3',5'-cyclic-AMP phosphodiesterase
MTRYLMLIFLLPLAGCDHFEFSPNQGFDYNTPINLNQKNLEKLATAPIDDTVTIAFVGDSQRFYDEVEKFVDKVNQIPEVDLIFLAGDISDFGLLSEYEWIYRCFSKLDKPYFGVLGNHDVIANGEQVFTRMFGPPDYSLVYDSIKFVVHNSNGREYPDKAVPDMDWLKNELQNEQNGVVKYFIPVSHVPPTHEDYNQSLVVPYAELMSTTPGLIASLHAHIHEHTDGYPFHDGIRYITSFAFNQNSFVLLKIKGTSITKKVITY